MLLCSNALFVVLAALGGIDAAPSSALDFPAWSWLAVVFSPGGDGDRKAPEHQAQFVHVVCLAPLSGHVPRYSKAAPVAAPTANKTVLAVALAAAANHGLDLLSGCCSLGSLDLR
jgi:hypothetical protein